MNEDLAYVHLPPGAGPPVLDIPTPFRAVVVAEQSVPADWQAQVSDWLVQSGCLYMMAWGADCSSWDDAVDLANMKAFDFGDIPEGKFVSTTWHADESLEQALWFAKHCAFDPVLELEHTVLVHIAAERNAESLVRAYRQA